MIKPGCANGSHIDIFADSSFASDPETGRSITGIFVMVDGTIVDWSSKHQPYVTLSSGDAEVVGTCSAATHAEYWLQMIGFVRSCSPHDIQCSIGTDSTTARNLLTNPVHTTVMKHIRTRLLFVRERIEAGLYEIYHLPGIDNPADMLTKPLSAATIRHLKQCLRAVYFSLHCLVNSVVSLGYSFGSFTL